MKPAQIGPTGKDRLPNEIPSLVWAAAIAGRTETIRLGTSRNSYAEVVDWPAVEPDRPYAVHLARDGYFRTLALDLDCKGESFYWTAEREARRANDLLQQCGFRTVLTESGGGGFHVFATFSEPVAAGIVRGIVTRLARRFQALDPSLMLNPATGCIRPPGALHRSGARSLVVLGSLNDLQAGSPPDALEKLDRALLPDATSQGAPNRAGAGLAPRSLTDLPPRIDRLLREGDIDRQYPSRSEVVQAIATGAVAAGWSLDQFLNALTNVSNKGGQKVQEMNPRRAKAYAEGSYTKALSHVANPAIGGQTSTEILGLLRAHCATVAWKGQAGATDLLVYRAFLEIGERVGRIRFHASCREVAEIAAIGRTTASISIRRLRERGYLRLAKRARDGDPHVFELATEVASSGHTSITPPLGDEIVPKTPHRDHEAFARRGLGPSAAKIYYLLQRTPARSATEIAVALGLNRTTVRRNLNKLERCRLAVGIEGIWIAKPRNLDEVALELGVRGYRSRKKQQHRNERRLFALARKESK